MQNKSFNKSKEVLVRESVKMLVPEDMAWAFDLDGFHEKNVRFWMEKLIKKSANPVVYDVGANYGYYSLYLSQYANQVYGFEPTSKVFKTLEQNVKRNKLQNIELFHMALSDHQGVGQMKLYSSSGNNSLFQRDLPEGHALKQIAVEDIDLNTLDDLIKTRDLQAPTFIKIDTEGSELYVLKGSKAILMESQAVIFMEFADSTYKDAGYTKKDVLDLLHELTYEVYGIVDDLEDMTLYLEKEFERVSIANIIAIPKGMKID